MAESHNTQAREAYQRQILKSPKSPSKRLLFLSRCFPPLPKFYLFIQCPGCSGVGIIDDYLDHYYGDFIYIPCEVCDGEGRILTTTE